MCKELCVYYYYVDVPRGQKGIIIIIIIFINVRLLKLYRFDLELRQVQMVCVYLNDWPILCGYTIYVHQPS